MARASTSCSPGTTASSSSCRSTRGNRVDHRNPDRHHPRGASRSSRPPAGGRLTRRAATTGALERRDQVGRHERATVTDDDVAGGPRPRRGDRRRPAAVPATRGKASLAEMAPADYEEIQVSRRQFFNRSIITRWRISIGASAPRRSRSSSPSRPAASAARSTPASASRTSQAYWDAQKAPYYVPEAAHVPPAVPEAGRAEGQEDPRVRPRHPGHGAGHRRAVPEVRAPRLPGAVVPDLAMVRVPVPRLEVQPGRREEGGPARVASTTSSSRSSRRQDRHRHRRSWSPARPSAPTPPARAPKVRRASDHPRHVLAHLVPPRSSEEATVTLRTLLILINIAAVVVIIVIVGAQVLSVRREPTERKTPPNQTPFYDDDVLEDSHLTASAALGAGLLHHRRGRAARSTGCSSRTVRSRRPRASTSAAIERGAVLFANKSMPAYEARSRCCAPTATVPT